MLEALLKKHASVRTRKVEKEGSLNNLLLSVIDETMKYIFREEGAQVVYTFLENSSHLKREEIVEKPKVFSAGLEKLLGSGAPLVKKIILKNL